MLGTCELNESPGREFIADRERRHEGHRLVAAGSFERSSVTRVDALARLVDARPLQNKLRDAGRLDGGGTEVPVGGRSACRGNVGGDYRNEVIAKQLGADDADRQLRRLRTDCDIGAVGQQQFGEARRGLDEQFDFEIVGPRREQLDVLVALAQR